MEDVCTILDATMQENRALEIACIDKEYGIVFEYTVPKHLNKMASWKEHLRNVGKTKGNNELDRI